MECDTGKLASVLALVRNFVGIGSTNPALKCIKFSGKNAFAADFDIAIKADLPDGLEFKSPVLVSGEGISSIASKLDGKAKIEVGEKAMTISDDTSKFKLALVSSGVFPEFPKEPEKYIQTPMIYHAIKAVRPFAGDSKKTLVYSSVYIDDDNVVATDFHHGLCLVSLPQKTGMKVISGLRFADLVTDEEGAEIGESDGRIFMRFNGGVMFGPTIEGVYSDYRKVFSSYSFPQSFTMKHSDFKDAIAKISVVARDGDMSVVKFKAESGTLTIESNRTSNSARVSIPANGDGKGEFYLNLQWIASWFRSTKCEEITMSCDTGTPRAVRFEGDINLKDGRSMHASIFVSPMIPPKETADESAS